MFEKLLEKTLYGVSKPVVQTYTSTMLNMDIHKKSPFPAGAKIIAPNHPSTTDPFYVASMLGHQSFIMINNVLFQVPILGEYLRRSGHIPVIAGKGQEAIDAALEHLKAGHTVMIFPEGLISPLGGGFNKARTGRCPPGIGQRRPGLPGWDPLAQGPSPLNEINCRWQGRDRALVYSRTIQCDRGQTVALQWRHGRS